MFIDIFSISQGKIYKYIFFTFSLQKWLKVPCRKSRTGVQLPSAPPEYETAKVSKNAFTKANLGLFHFFGKWLKNHKKVPFLGQLFTFFFTKKPEGTESLLAVLPIYDYWCSIIKLYLKCRNQPLFVGLFSILKCVLVDSLEHGSGGVSCKSYGIDVWYPKSDQSGCKEVP